MSQSTPICFLFCSKCKRKDMRNPHHYDRDHSRNYLDIEVLGPSGRLGIKCRCRRCGHEYVSTSAAGRRARNKIDAKEGK